MLSLIASRRPLYDRTACRRNDAGQGGYADEDCDTGTGGGSAQANGAGAGHAGPGVKPLNTILSWTAKLSNCLTRRGASLNVPSCARADRKLPRTVIWTNTHNQLALFAAGTITLQ